MGARTTPISSISRAASRTWPAIPCSPTTTRAQRASASPWPATTSAPRRCIATPAIRKRHRPARRRPAPGRSQRSSGQHHRRRARRQQQHGAGNSDDDGVAFEGGDYLISPATGTSVKVDRRHSLGGRRVGRLDRLEPQWRLGSRGRKSDVLFRRPVRRPGRHSERRSDPRGRGQYLVLRSARRPGLRGHLQDFRPLPL